MTDTIVQEVIAEHERRATMGERKYGVTLDRDDLDSPAWLMHLRDELMDGALYATKAAKRMALLESLLYRMALHICNSDETEGVAQACALLTELRELNPDKYDREVPQ